MRIEYLYIKNFKNIIEEEIINFNNINLIIGDNGNGKSGFSEALVFLLTNHLNDKIERFVRWGQKEFILKTKFNFLSKNYNYEIIGSTSTKRVLTIEGDSEEYRNSDATKKLSEIIDPILTLYSAISEQGETTKLLFEGNSERLEKLKKLFGIEKLKEKDKQQKEDIDKNKEIIKITEAEVNILEGRTFVFEEEPTLPNIDDSLKKLEQLQKDKEIYDKEQSDYKVYQEKVKQYEEADDQINQLNIKKWAISKQTFEKKQLPKFDKDFLDKLIEQKIELEKELIELEKDISLYEQNQKQFKELEDEILQQEENLKSIGRIKRNKKPEIDYIGIKAKKSSLNKIYEIYLNQKNTFEAVKEGKCDKCGTEWKGGDINSVENLMILAKEQYEGLKEEIGKDEIILENYQKVTNENNIIQSKIDQVNLQLRALKTKYDCFVLIPKPQGSISGYESLLNQIDSDISLLKLKEKKYLRIQKENDEIEQEQKEHETELKIIESKIEEYKKIRQPREFKFTVQFDNNEYIKVQEDISIYNEKKKELGRIKEQNQKLRKEKDQIKKDIEIKYNLIDDLRLLNKKIEEARKNLNKDFASWLIEKGTNKIQDGMNDFFQKSYDGKYKVSIQQEKNSVDFYYGTDDNMISVNMASGFEKALLATSFRKSLCSLQSLGIFIMDESDSDSSDENSVKLFKTLIEPNNQYFIITHSPDTKQMLINDYNAKVFEFQNGKII